MKNATKILIFICMLMFFCFCKDNNKITGSLKILYPENGAVLTEKNLNVLYKLENIDLKKGNAELSIYNNEIYIYSINNNTGTLSVELYDGENILKFCLYDEENHKLPDNIITVYYNEPPKPYINRDNLYGTYNCVYNISCHYFPPYDDEDEYEDYTDSNNCFITVEKGLEPCGVHFGIPYHIPDLWTDIDTLGYLSSNWFVKNSSFIRNDSIYLIIYEKNSLHETLRTWNGIKNNL
ncbi:MAG: hypothetical protein LBV69_11610 [Bacteroidales bacterium]|jgi:hypothetical protein|nr:hypothetical protein [Bacteroidales bacterium]